MNLFYGISSSGKDSFKFLTKYLATFSGEDAYAMAEAKEEAVRTIIVFVKAPDIFQVCLTGFWRYVMSFCISPSVNS